VACKVTLQNNKHLIICLFYRPPDNDAPYVTELCNVFQEISNAYKNSLIWIAEDLVLTGVSIQRVYPYQIFSWTLS